jgi:hypothetical protein
MNIIELKEQTETAWQLVKETSNWLLERPVNAKGKNSLADEQIFLNVWDEWQKKLELYHFASNFN